MDSIVTDKRNWSRTEVAELLISKTALTDLRMEHALQIVRLLVPQRIQAGTVLIQEGVTNTGYMALVLQGDAIVKNDLEGSVNDSMVLSVLGCGSLFGELGVLDGKPRSATVIAITDMDIAVLDRPGLARLIETVPTVACALMGSIMARIAERLRATNIKLAEVTSRNLALQDQMARQHKPPPGVDVNIDGSA